MLLQSTRHWNIVWSFLLFISPVLSSGIIRTSITKLSSFSPEDLSNGRVDNSLRHTEETDRSHQRLAWLPNKKKKRRLYYGYDDDANDVDDAAQEAEEAGDDGNDDKQFYADELCSQYLFSFLGGTTDASDNCEGIKNAYTAAYCNAALSSGYDDEDGDDDHDDYFNNYEHFSCCESLKTHYDVYCESNEMITNMHLLLIAVVLLLCEMAKSIIKTRNMHFLPEAGGCVLVGTFIGAIAHLTETFNLDDLSFNEELFLCILLPPIIFEAALSVNKKEFRRRRLAILMFAVMGTIMSTFMTGFMVHYTSKAIDTATTIPMLDSFIFGALISSIDPVAILSVLSGLNLTEKDTVFIMVLGESLLNDGISITLFKSLVRRYDNDGRVSSDEILGACADFLIVGFGSIFIGLLCGFACLIYFWMLKKRLNPGMEVASFFLWAGIPYYICDGIELSGIVSIVTIAFFMDIYIAAPRADINIENYGPSSKRQRLAPLNETHQNYIDLGDSIPCNPDGICGTASPSARSLYSLHSLRTLNMRELLFREERFRLSAEADRHVRFVAHLLSQLSENAIFVYLGLFLFSNNYDWEIPLCIISIIACTVGRALMVMINCWFIWYISVFRTWCGFYKPTHVQALNPEEPQVSRTAVSLQDRKVQLVLVLSGLRGAVSLALVESVPIYNAVTLQGTKYKPALKAMTSSAIIFTMFIFGGSAYYILNGLNIKSDTNLKTSLLPQEHQEKKHRPKPESPLRTKTATFLEMT